MSRSLFLFIVLLVGWMIFSGYWYTCKIKGICHHSTNVDNHTGLVNDQINKNEVAPLTLSEVKLTERKDNKSSLNSLDSSEIRETIIEKLAANVRDTGLDSIKILKKSQIPCPILNLNQTQPTISDILFDYNSSEIVCKAKLRAFAQATKTYLSTNIGSVIITGHTDDDNTSINNLALGLKRAISVKKLLIEEGISANRISTFSHGDIEPIEDNKTMSARQKNRRVSIELN